MDKRLVVLGLFGAAVICFILMIFDSSPARELLPAGLAFGFGGHFVAHL